MPPHPDLFGLTQAELSAIVEVLKKFPEIETSVIFGSRALGSYKRGSDVDIALFGKNLETVVTMLSYELNEELPLPYFFDVVDYNGITTKEFKEHIDRVGRIFYKK